MSQKILKFIVIFLGILIVICFLALVYGLYIKTSKKQSNLETNLIDYNLNLEIRKNLIIWNLNQGQINSLEFSYWSLNKLLIGISIIFVIIIFAYLLRFYRFKLGSDLPQLPSK